MADNLVERLRANSLPGDRQYHREARIVLRSLLDEAADRVADQQKYRKLSEALDYFYSGEGLDEAALTIQRILHPTKHRRGQPVEPNHAVQVAVQALIHAIRVQADPGSLLTECPGCGGPLEFKTMNHSVEYGTKIENHRVVETSTVEFEAPVHWCEPCEIKYCGHLYEKACDEAVEKARQSGEHAP